MKYMESVTHPNWDSLAKWMTDGSWTTDPNRSEIEDDLIKISEFLRISWPSKVLYRGFVLEPLAFRGLKEGKKLRITSRHKLESWTTDRKRIARMYSTGRYGVILKRRFSGSDIVLDLSDERVIRTIKAQLHGRHQAEMVVMANSRYAYTWDRNTVQSVKN